MDTVSSPVMAVRLQDLSRYQQQIMHLLQSYPMKELPAAAERELHIKASFKTYRTALRKWGYRTYLSRQQKMEMTAIAARWRTRGRSVNFRVNGELYNQAKVRRFIRDDQKAGLNGKAAPPDTEITPPIYYFDPDDPTTDLMALDLGAANGHNSNTGVFHGNTAGPANCQILQSSVALNEVAEGDATSVSQDLGNEADIYQAIESVFPEQSGGIWALADTSQALLWHINIDPSLVTFARTLFSRHFPLAAYDPKVMAGLLNNLLESDRLEEATDIATLAMSIADTIYCTDINNEWYWQAKGDLARVHHAKGDYGRAHEFYRECFLFYQSTTSDKHPRTIFYDLNVAEVLLELGRVLEAKARCREVIIKTLDVDQPDSDLSIRAQLLQAKICNAVCSWQEAKVILEPLVTEYDHAARSKPLKLKLQIMIEFANTLHYLGDDSPAIGIISAVEKELEHSMSHRSMWTYELVRSVGVLLFDTRHYVGAEKVFSDLFRAINSTIKPTRHPKAIEAKTWIACTLSRQDRSLEASAMFEECLEVLTDVLGPGHRYTIRCMSNLTLSRFKKLKLVDVNTELAKVQAACVQVLGENDPETLRLGMYRAKALQMSGQWGASRDLLRRIQSKHQAIEGPNRVLTFIKYSHHLGEFYAAKGQFDRAILQQKKVLHAAELFFGKDHPVTIEYMYPLAESLSNVEKYDEAEAMLLDGKARLTGSVGAKHPATTFLIVEIAKLLSARRQWKKTEILQKEILDTWKQYGGNHPYVIDAMTELIWTLVKRGQFDEAQEVGYAAIAAAKTTFGPKSFEARMRILTMASLMRYRKKSSEARDLCRTAQAMSPYSDHYASNCIPVSELMWAGEIEAMSRTAMIFADVGELNEAAKLLSSVLSHRSAFFGADHRITLQSASNLARVLARSGQFDAASALQRDTLQKLEHIYGPKHEATLLEKRNLFESLRSVNSLSECKIHLNDVISEKIRVCAAVGAHTNETVDEIVNSCIERSRDYEWDIPGQHTAMIECAVYYSTDAISLRSKVSNFQKLIQRFQVSEQVDYIATPPSSDLCHNQHNLHCYQESSYSMNLPFSPGDNHENLETRILEQIEGAGGSNSLSRIQCESLVANSFWKLSEQQLYCDPLANDPGEDQEGNDLKDRIDTWTDALESAVRIQEEVCEKSLSRGGSMFFPLPIRYY